MLLLFPQAELLLEFGNFWDKKLERSVLPLFCPHRQRQAGLLHRSNIIRDSAMVLLLSKLAAAVVEEPHKTYSQRKVLP